MPNKKYAKKIFFQYALADVRNSGDMPCKIVSHRPITPQRVEAWLKRRYGYDRTRDRLVFLRYPEILNIDKKSVRA